MDATQIVEESHCFFYKNIDTIITIILNNLSQVAQLSIGRLSLEKKFRALVGREENWNIHILPLIIQKWPLLEGHIDDTNYRKVKDFVFAIRPWEPNPPQFTNNPQICWFVEFVNKWIKPEVNYVPYNLFLVFGCPASTDIDVAVFVTNRDDVFGQIDEDKIRTELQELGYDIDYRKVDLAFVYMKNNVIINTGKGGKEIQNIIIHTYRYHRQKYPCPEFEIMPVDIQEKISATAKFIIDKLKILLLKQTYRNIRNAKIENYIGEWKRVEFSIAMFPTIILEANPNEKWRRTMKSIVMKICQLILVENNILEYTKDGLAKKISDIFCQVDHQSLQYLLFWKKEGKLNTDLLAFLFNKYQMICEKHQPTEVVWIKHALNSHTNPTKLSDILFQEFVNSPFEPTEKFIQEWEKRYDSTDASSMFIMQSDANSIPKDVQDSHVIDISQRTPEWKNLLTFYKCGDNSVDKSKWIDVRGIYHLIAGNIIEDMAIQQIDWQSLFPDNYVEIASVGLLVKEKGVQNSPGIAPDLLLVIDETKIVPVEIKCLAQKPVENLSKDGNKNYRHKVSLAVRQIESTLDILDENQGIVCLINVYIEDDKAKFEAHLTIINNIHYS